MPKKFAQDFSGWVRSKIRSKSEHSECLYFNTYFNTVFCRIKFTFFVQDDFFAFSLNNDITEPLSAYRLIQGYDNDGQKTQDTAVPVVLTGSGWKKEFSTVFGGVPVVVKSPPVFCSTLLRPCTV